MGNKTFPFLLLILLALRTQGSEFNFSSAFILPGISVSYSNRTPFRNHDNIDRVEQLTSKKLLSLGALAGKRFPINHKFRLQITADVHYGRNVADTLFNVSLTDETIRDLLRYEYIFSAGILPQIQHQLPLQNNANSYFYAGVGLFYSTYKEKLYDFNQTITIEDSQLSSSSRFSFALKTGIGVEFPVSNKIGGAVVYGIKFWRPVEYNESRDLFPMGIDYRERFITHSLTIHLLLPDPSRSQ
ncbi:hypothetical protein QA601_09535 [Chitinispirillales bacterium ANBcel5]|uniref:hypothetical protein n=1 Tax=Cellulosispirillum alkaliphilum TaxID=3039283 RepID=UPI002A50EB4A|nr:hypothetical protein [Chitinispirillales bacterium ANBcel5]